MDVLIVEDSVLIANAVKILLEREHISVMQTTKGEETVQLAKEGNAKVIILDLMMPELSGEEIFKMLKSTPETAAIKIMILTAKTDALKWNPLLQSCDAFMNKPFDNKKLVAEVKRLLSS